MRQRKVKNLEEKYAKYEDILVYDPEALKGRWEEKVQEAGCKGLYLEVGCGKGKFISEMAERYPERFFIAVEGNKSVLLRAMEKIRRKNLRNVVFVPEFIVDLTDWFRDEEVDGIYLNFSDPLPKNYSAKKRLTHRSKLQQYERVLKDDGIVTFKTDNTGLFEFTIQEILASDMKIHELTRDLHHCEYNEDNIMTEYEAKFSTLGENIKRVKFGRKEGRKRMADMSFAAYNGRVVPKEDKIFGISGRAKAAIAKKGKENVINATIGALLDDEGKLIVLSSVDEAVKALSPAQYAEYAPIAGTPGFKEAIVKAALGDYEPKGYVGVVASPGGTGSLRNAIANYTCLGDKFLTHDWHWGTYKNIGMEIGRGEETFDMFDEEGNFNLADFEYKVKKLLRIQDRLLIIINTPANNPTGYSLSDEDWDGVIRVLNDTDPAKKVALVVDVAYIDFAGDEKEVRSFLPKLEELNGNVLPMLAYSASKTFTFYGCRCAATICIAKNAEVRDEFERVLAFSARASWSNSPRMAQEVIAKIYSDPELLAKVDQERAGFRNMLLSRGHAFEEEAAKVGLQMVPFRGGFFCSVPCEDPDAISKRLEEVDVFVVPFTKGVRVSIASISEEKCRKLPKMIKEALEA
ncbi:MAG: tRNA (guanosine(46)-N7)-methyltransferase TrmB [Eubacteriales bacterium]|nr:tRNA (guanosine(46)-N7)-methyltransferase TrmB [Eubacteriales bacterium]